MHTGSIVEGPDAPAERLRSHLHGMWAAVAAGWGFHADYVEARGAGVTQVMLDRAQPQPGERVLELACGAGDVGIAAAGRVAPDGDVVLSDFAAEMTTIAAERAAAAGVANVSTCELELERIDQPDASYDVVLCREGLMFAVDPAAAAGEIRRVLRPGGRVVAALWGPRERNPWLRLVFDAVSAQTGSPVPPPGVPGPFSLADIGRLGELLRGADLRDVRITELPTPLRAGSFEDWWVRTTALAGPLANVLAALPDDALQAIRASLREAVAPVRDWPGSRSPV